MLLLVEGLIMAENKTNHVKIPFYKKAIGVSIMIAVAVYCIAELQGKVISAIDFLKGEWRKQR